MSYIRTVLGLVASLNFEIEQMDVKLAFLQGALEEKIYMNNPGVSKKMVKKTLCANSKRVSMAQNKLLNSGTRSLNLL